MLDLKPTIPNTVTPGTELSDLNLNWHEQDLHERDRTKHVHRLHPYLGKFIPQLAEIFLRKFFEPGQTVLDPFCGSGTTLIQANEMGINAIGADISAFNILLSKVKTERYDIRKVKYEVLDILDKVRVFTRGNGHNPLLWKLELVEKPLSKVAEEYFKKWFADQTITDILTYKYFLEDEDYEYKDLLKIILSRATRSSRLTTHYNLDFPKKPQYKPYYCYKHSRTCTPIEEAYKFLRRYSIDTIRRIEEFSKLRTKSAIVLKHGDSRDIKFPFFDGVITSPPYLGLIDYHEQHIYAYHLLNLEDKRAMEIGAAANGSGPDAKIKYIEDISAVFNHITKFMNPSGRLIVIANDKLNMYKRIAELSELETEDVLKRHVTRRTGMRSNKFYESIFIWKKKER